MTDEIRIVEVKQDFDQQNVLKNLLKMYCYEWSQYNLSDVDEKGEFEFEHYLPTYWTHKDRHALLVRVGDTWAGFALMDKDFYVHNEYDHAMAEFFIMYKYRRNGVGSYVARRILEMFPGNWELGRNPKNIGSVKFWDHVLGEHTHEHYESASSCPGLRYPDGTLGDVLSFKESDIPVASS